MPLNKAASGSSQDSNQTPGLLFRLLVMIEFIRPLSALVNMTQKCFCKCVG